MADAERDREPIRQSVHVDCPIDDAFQLFTERLAEWWPLGSCTMEPFEGGRVFERTAGGEEVDWGTVTAWEPPRRVEFTSDRGTVDVEFSVEADGTRVTLTHAGWQLAVSGPTCVMVAGVAGHFARFAAREIMVAV
jgi:uncharacterized protein YndB with AHSA1/START domain